MPWPVVSPLAGETTATAGKRAAGDEMELTEREIVELPLETVTLKVGTAGRFGISADRLLIIKTAS